jgi:hypothetical protein
MEQWTETARRALAEAVAKAGSQTAWAEAHDFPRPYIAQVLAGDRPASAKMLAALGLELRAVPQTAR